MTAQQIKELSTAELFKKMAEFKEIEINEDLQQYCYKILINSVK